MLSQNVGETRVMPTLFLFVQTFVPTTVHTALHDTILGSPAAHGGSKMYPLMSTQQLMDTQQQA